MQDKNLDVIIMEPMKGGSLINLPKDALKITYDNCPNISPAKLAQKWVYEKDISLILSGMSTMDMVRENMSIASLTDPIVLSESEKNAAKEVKKLLDSRVKVPCTECNYCMPCLVVFLYRMFFQSTIKNMYLKKRENGGKI